MRLLNLMLIAVNSAFACYMIANGSAVLAAVSGGAAAFSALITFGWQK